MPYLNWSTQPCILSRLGPCTTHKELCTCSQMAAWDVTPLTHENSLATSSARVQPAVQTCRNCFCQMPDWLTASGTQCTAAETSLCCLHAAGRSPTPAILECIQLQQSWAGHFVGLPPIRTGSSRHPCSAGEARSCGHTYLAEGQAEE